VTSSISFLMKTGTDGATAAADCVPMYVYVHFDGTTGGRVDGLDWIGSDHKTLNRLTPL